jgi:hypothetical protein
LEKVSIDCTFLYGRMHLTNSFLPVLARLRLSCGD